MTKAFSIGRISSLILSARSYRLLVGWGVTAVVLLGCDGPSSTGKARRTMPESTVSSGRPIPQMNVEFSRDGMFLVAGDALGYLRVWRVRGDASPLVWKGHATYLKDVAVSVRNRLLASAAGDGTARIWNLADGKLLHTLTSAGRHFECVAFAPAEDALFTATRGPGSVVQRWAFSGERPTDVFRVVESKLARKSQTGGRVHSMAISLSGEKLALGVSGGTLLIQLESGDEQWWLPSDGVVMFVGFTDDSRRLVTASLDTVACVDVETVDVTRTLRAGGYEFAMNADGSTVVAVDPGAVRIGPSRVLVCSLRDGIEQCEWKVRGTCITSVSLSADGTLLATGEYDGKVSVWRLSSSLDSNTGN